MRVFSFPRALAYTKDSFTTRIKMYTRCPICKTNFSVTEAQLQVAQGKVRCGSCKNVFNARQHIHYHSSLPASRKKKSQETPPAATTKKPSPHFSNQTGSHTQKEVVESKTIAKKVTPRIKHAELFEPPADNKTAPPSSIDAIFNALDSQLTSGTYIDIAKPVDTDIREADFDATDTDELDLNIEDPTLQTNNTSTPITIDDSPIKATPAPVEKNTTQHTFNFASMASKPKSSIEDKKQFSAVNTPFKAQPDLNLKKQNENAALHQAIDNIIKVDSHITTPFEEHDDDHFVIEMETQPDVELVDEDDIDKLFASTDSLKISDLKFDKHLTNSQIEEPISILKQNNVRPEIEADAKEELSDNETSFNLQVESQLKPENFESEYTSPKHFTPQELDSDDFNLENSISNNVEPKNVAPEDFDSENIEQNNSLSKAALNKIDFDSDWNSDNTSLELDTDNFDIEEEIVLSGSEINPDKSEINVPHRLRDAVASFDQQTASISITKRLLYSLASLLLMLLLATQLVLFKSTALANSIPALQPVLTSLCNNLPCRYTGNHDSKQIKIISRDVRLHPKIKGALLISATIINQANYAQPYPTILLKFTDLSANTVAQRYFSPKDYLGLLNKPFALMPSKKPVQLNIEILDPGSDAINFQFYFL